MEGEEDILQDLGEERGRETPGGRRGEGEEFGDSGGEVGGGDGFAVGLGSGDDGLFLGVPVLRERRAWSCGSVYNPGLGWG